MPANRRRESYDGLDREALQLWASQRRQSVHQKPWRGSVEWGAPYEEVAAQWRADGKKGLPPAFRDGEARPKQLAPGTPGAESDRADFFTLVMLMGRGFGKTRGGAEMIQERVVNGQGRRIALVGPTSASVRQLMLEGESGLLSIADEGQKPRVVRNEVHWPNGAVGYCITAEEPERLRGYQFDTAWCDELAAWRYLETAWDNLMYGLRLGEPKNFITTTPKPLKLLKTILKMPSTVVYRGSTYENEANLAPSFFEVVVANYEGTRLGRQELHAEILDQVEGALWKYAQLDELRWTVAQYQALARGVPRPLIGVDPSGGIAETGIVGGGRTGDRLPCRSARTDTHLLILGDYTVGGSPDEWGQAVVNAYYELLAARVVAETNQGGAMVEAVIRTVDPNVAYKGVHAAKGKHTRAEPVAALFEQERGHMVGHFPEMEQELCEWVPGNASPNRLDAMVHMATEAMAAQGAPDISASTLAGLQIESPSIWKGR